MSEETKDQISIHIVEECFHAFLSGRSSFDGLVRDLKAGLADARYEAADIHAVIADFQRRSDLPNDLAEMIKAVVPAATQSASDPKDGDDDASDMFDEATLPYEAPFDVAEDPKTQVASGPPISTFGPEPAFLSTDNPEEAARRKEHDRVRSKVDDVVLNALVKDYRSYRKGNTEEQKDFASAKPDVLDGLLSNYQSVRYRSDAKRIKQGRKTQELQLGSVSDAHEKRATIGSLLRDRFILDAEIGKGGMGIVYSAVDRRRLEAGSPEPYVALKLLNDSFRSNSAALLVLESEARKAQSLAHPNITTVYDFDRDKSEIFIVMELLTGKPLNRLLSKQLGSPMPPHRINQIVQGMCSGLSYAHNQGVVHSDLKPGNVFVTDDGQTKLLDFGLAVANAPGGFDVATLNGLTAPYASPEMFEGAPRDPRDDIFALGCITYQLIAGVHPFEMRSSEDAAHDNMQVDIIPDLDPGAWEVIASSLQFDRDKRLSSVDDFYSGLFES
ncbi:serine/threonine-protein kinase [uncultured Cohaesibacter sp.]|uniref:serine/threonine-protein kinase n=1 Tax=uncultured Cohaesibacter sp. TaxID=1002546 RepID=UPI0029C8BCA9|nr:serine/threonine-protein kinase [uncultured Cohaesibacter sp.]